MVWLAANAPAAAATELECTVASGRPDLPAYVDVRQLRISLDGDMVKVALTLRDLAVALPYDRYAPYDAEDWEYLWALGVDTDNNPANDVSFDTSPYYGRKIGDQLLGAAYTPSGGPATTGLLANLPLQATTGKAMPNPGYPGGIEFDTQPGGAAYAVDPATNTITITGRLPGVSAQSKFHAITFDRNDRNTTKSSLVDPCMPTATVASPTPTPGAPGQDGFTVQTGIIPVQNAVVTSTGALSSRNLTVDLTLADLAPAAANTFSAGGYNVYVVALTPAGTAGPVSTWFMKHPAPRWDPLLAGAPLSAFLQNVQASSQDARIRIEILRDQNLGSLIGTEFYIGYGTSDSEMLQNRRYRAIYKVAQ